MPVPPVNKGLDDPPRCTATRACDALFVLSALGVGGSERKIARLTAALAEDGMRIALCALGAPYTLQSELHQAVQVATLDRRRRVSPRVVRALRALLIAQRPRTLIAVDLFALLHVRVALWLAGRSGAQPGDLPKPAVVALLNTTSFVRRRDRWFMLGYAPLLRSAELLVFGSRRQRDAWRQRYALGQARSDVIHNGVDAQRFQRAATERHAARQRLAIPAQRIVLGTVGRLAPEKNQLALVRALARLRAEGVDAQLLLAGDGPMRAAIQSEARALRVADRVTLTGEIPDVRLPLAAMDVFVLPSTAVETFSNAALEAMSMRLPVVLTDIGGAREMVTDGTEGFIVRPGDQPALDQALRKLCLDAPLADRMGAAARARVERDFTFPGMVAAYRAIIGVPPAVPKARSVTVAR